MKNFKLVVALLMLLFATLGYSQNQEPVISGLYAWADVPNNMLHVYYDVSDNEGEDVEVFLGVSSNGTVFSVSTSGVTGDLGFPITVGAGKEIIWDYGTSHPQTSIANPDTGSWYQPDQRSVEYLSGTGHQP